MQNAETAFSSLETNIVLDLNLFRVFSENEFGYRYKKVSAIYSRPLSFTG